MPPKILVISGPTASGKTRMGVELCQMLGGEVISADSMQIYRRMDIGTAKPTPSEMGGIPHHMLDVADPEENYSVARYVSEAAKAIDGVLSRGKLPVVVGGTGLYIDSLVSGRSFAVHATGWREKLQERVRQEGIAPLWKELQRIDPEAAQRLHPNDEKRVVRALEVWYESGKTITQHNRETQALPPRYEAVTLTLNFQERRDLWDRIDRRVDLMMEQGLVEEVRQLLSDGVPADCTAMQAIGYKEMAAVLLSGGDPLDAAEEIKLRSRQYAKRQLTWFRRNRQAEWILWDRQPDFAGGRRKAADFVKASGL
jgi:tRNA dimethylallyltransferase